MKNQPIGKMNWVIIATSSKKDQNPFKFEKIVA
jgi:hypothetical protein